MTRYAKIAAAPERVRPYLPDNYRVRTWGPGAIPGTYCTIIEGEDNAGWTLDDYVLPRLASGLYFGEEIFPFETVATVEVES